MNKQINGSIALNQGFLRSYVRRFYYSLTTFGEAHFHATPQGKSKLTSTPKIKGHITMYFVRKNISIHSIIIERQYCHS